MSGVDNHPGRPGLFFSALAAALYIASVPRADARSGDDLSALRQEASQVTIVRDDWGIAHVHGHTDRDAVFGMAYTQAEDDFNRVETNYLTALGRTAEASGEAAIWQDLRQRLFIDPTVLKADYAASPASLRLLMDGWADGLNWYLATHPDVRPLVIRHFEPWMALSFTEGSIGGDTERVPLKELQDFYGTPGTTATPVVPATATRSGLVAPKEPGGSNGIAIAPANTRDGHALLLINPHTSFFFRSELQMTSDEGLDAYGAVTWGQFFVYQGFNQHIGWMHTSSGVDAVDEFTETVTRHGNRLLYRYGNEERPVTVTKLQVRYRTPSGSMASRSFAVYGTHHGPVIRAAGSKWISIALMNTPVAALSQSWLRTKSFDYASFLKIAVQFNANSSNNTIFADDKGEIAYLHPQFIPSRDDRFDYTRPVNGADPASDWKGLVPFERTPHVVDPPNGWVMNTNDWPYSAAGPFSPKELDFPRYMDSFGENPRGMHATRLLTGTKGWTLEGLNRAAFDPYLPAFAKLIPPLLQSYDGMPGSDPLKVKLRDQVMMLRGWDDRWSAGSIPTSLAVFWGEDMWARAAAGAKTAGISPYDWMEDRIPPREKLQALAEASDRIAHDFGDWRTPWGRINRFQRLDDQIDSHFSDAQPSIPVPFTSSRWGSLASFGAHAYPNTRKWYGTLGNSFVAAVEFGPRIRAVAVTAGGESGHPGSPHFEDEADRYATGHLREVYFYPDQLKGHTERTYHPGL
ncbi:acylase [Lichenicola cladoniae]|uniref:Acylase n=1 Tax=Lichenicola cladoniae TaxID=1484109 RepID=A0A6M8HLN7_9PROT|nr:penicillin acylase family protein [Lichenicola cladoniae]NPD70220.1 acylase [Acetobacteraceae bacterium]QKE89258.1 acylase [Lichenicola cladoniae]